MSTLVVYYSKSGNNRYLAQRLAAELKADLDELHPRMGAFGVLVLCSLIKAGPGFRPLRHDPAAYDEVILVGPIWMGQLIAPLRGFLKKHARRIRRLHFATCCGGGDDAKDDKFGYGRVFQLVKGLAGDACGACQAFPIILALPEEKRGDGQVVMKTRLNDENFTGPLEERFKAFIADMAAVR